MNKKLLTLTCASMLMLGANACLADTNEPTNAVPAPQNEVAMPKHSHPHIKFMKHKMKHGMRGDELATKLNLTEEQRKKAEEIRKADFEKMKPLFDEMKALHEKMDSLRKENMKAFEEILTPEQKSQFEKIREEHKAKMEQMKKEHHHPERDRRHAPDGNDIPAKSE